MDGLVTLDEESAVGLSHVLHVKCQVWEFCQFFIVSIFAQILLAFCSNFARIFPMTLKIEHDVKNRASQVH